MAFFYGPTFMVRLLAKSICKVFGPSLGVIRMWTKRNDHAPKSECADVFNVSLKRAILKKNQVK